MLGRPRRSYPTVLGVAFGALLCANILWAVLLDPFKVFGVLDVNKRNFEPNTRYLKIEHLKKNDYGGFILGNSRVNGYGVDISTTLIGVNFYNMTAPGDTPTGILLKLRWLLEHQPIKHVVIAVSINDFVGNDGDNEWALHGLEHPDVSDRNGIFFYWKYIWAHPRHHLYNIYNNFIKEQTWWRFEKDTGHYYFTEIEQRLETDLDGLVAERYAAMPYFTPVDARIGASFLRDFDMAIKSAHQNGVPVTVIVSPHYYRAFLSYDVDTYADWLEEIVGIAGEVWDFSGLNSVTTDEQFYFDTSHFSFQMGELVLRRIFDPQHPMLSRYPGFGVRVTRSTLPDRIAVLKRERAEW